MFKGNSFSSFCLLCKNPKASLLKGQKGLNGYFWMVGREKKA